MAPHSWAHRVKKPKAKWSMTVMMNARDLSRDDDFLSHLLVEHLGTDDSPLQVHKMDPSRRLPKHDPAQVLAIVKKYIVRGGGSATSAHRVKRAVDALLELNAVKQYLHKRSTAQINAFATHASRYFELYLPSGSIEISHTSRYSHRTGKSELCILATTPLKVGQVISDLKGSLAHLTAEEDEELKKTDSRRRDGGIRRDFSVIHSNQRNKSHLFLGPARFVNHDCDHNVELFRDGRVITFRVLKPIATGQEVTAHYGEGYCTRIMIQTSVTGESASESLGPTTYFRRLLDSQRLTCDDFLVGKGNRHCLCETCEKLGKGGYAPVEANSEDEVEDDSSTDEETRDQRIKAGLGLTAKGNPNERRTRRGVYAILPEEDTDNENRVGVTEAATVPAAMASAEPCVKSAKVADVVSETTVAMALSSLNLTPVSSPSSVPGPFSTFMPDGSTRRQNRRLSDTSSTLTALSDIDKPVSRVTMETPEGASKSSQPLVPLPPLSGTGSVASCGPSALQHASGDTAVYPPTPATSRMSTRSSTASPSKRSQEEQSPSGVAHINQLQKRILRSSRTPAEGLGVKESPKQPVTSKQALPARTGRLSKHSSSSVTTTSAVSNALVTKGSPNRVNQKKSQSRSVTAVKIVDGLEGVARRCGTCSNEMPSLAGSKGLPNVVDSCARCKRHVAIFGAPWPNRISALEELSSSSSDLSSNETVIETPREKVKEATTYIHKLKLPKKYVEVKHHSLERPMKRRKTDPLLYATGAHPHLDKLPRNPKAQLHDLKKLRRQLSYTHKKFTIPGGAQQSRARSALDRKASKRMGSLFSPLGAKRRWGNAFGDREDPIPDVIRSRERLWGASYDLKGSRTIRHVGSLHRMLAARPLAALCARPTPNLFARVAWAASSVSNDEPSVDTTLKEPSSELTDVPEPRPKPTSNSPKLALTPTPKVGSPGQKRKLDLASYERKQRLGKTFYMKDESKPMPKGWVLVTDSSEETGEDDEEGGRKAAGQLMRSEGPQPGAMRLRGKVVEPDQLAGSLGSTPDSVLSLPHTPSSRAESTPTQSSGTLVEEQASVTPTDIKPVAVAYSLRKNPSSRMPSTVQSVKRRKLTDGGNASASRIEDWDAHCNTDSKNDTRFEDRDDRVDFEPIGDAFSCAPTSTVEVGVLKDKEERNFTGKIFPNSSVAKVEQDIAESDHFNTSLFESHGAFTMTSQAITEVPDSEIKRLALEVSNMIHGTAFSYGHPDARMTWKPKYCFSELDGWKSNIGT